MSAVTLRPKDVSIFLAAMIKAHHASLLVGPPGVGKSDLVEQATRMAGADYICSHPVVDDPTAGKGYPWLQPGKDHAEHIPYGELYRALNAKKLTVWNIEDFGQATPAVQASYMQLFLARRSNGKTLPKHVVFVVTTNRRTDRAGVQGILEPVKSRFVSIVNVEPNLDDLCNWAIDKGGWAVSSIAFLRFRPELMHQFNPTADLENSPCPRTWDHADKVLKLNLPPAIELAAVQGAVGEGPGAERIAFERIYRELPSLDAILLDPDEGIIPDSPASLYAVVVGLASKATESNFSRIARYAERMQEASKGEFAVLLIRDCIKRNPKVVNTAAFIKIASTDIGKLISGEA